MKQHSILSVQHLSKRFGSYQAVSDVSFEVKPGEIIGLLGPNGAGKTTVIQMLLGLTKPTEGDIKYFGMSLEHHRSTILERINSTSGYARMPWKLTVYENLLVFAHLYSVEKPKQRILDLAEQLQMTDLLNKKFLDLSAGQVTRCMLAKCFLNQPELVLLDEPTASLDPEIADHIRSYILDERKKRKLSILITSHNMTEVEELCERVIMLQKGQIYAIDTPNQLAAQNHYCLIKLMITDGLKRTTSYLTKHNIQFAEHKRFVTITIEENLVGSFLQNLAKEKINYREIEIIRPSLEDFFISLAKK